VNLFPQNHATRALWPRFQRIKSAHPLIWTVVLLDDVYADLARYKNFFQPTTKLVQKRRVKGKLHRVYETPKTPSQRLLESGQLSVTACERLKMTYRSLNPAELKRRIDQHRDRLFATFENTGPKRRPPTRKMTPRLVRSFMTQQGTSR
jgi:hypothetical protein